MCAVASILEFTILRTIPPESKAPRLLGSTPSYWFSRVVASTGPHPLSLSVVPLSFSCSRLDSVDGGVRCLAYTSSFWDLPVETGNESRSTVFIAVRPSEDRSGLCLRLCADAWRPLRFSLSSSWSSSSNARAVCLVQRDSSQSMSLCIVIPARASGLIALLCNSCMVSRLLFICDVESALSLFAEAVILLGCACGVRACFDVSCIIFP